MNMYKMKIIVYSWGSAQNPEVLSLGFSKKELILDNHSRVMYDYNLIPKDQIRESTI